LALRAPRHCETGARRFGTRCFLVLLPEREPDALEVLRIEPREHVRLVLDVVGAAMQEHSSAMLRDPRVVTSRETIAACTPRKREQLRETEAPVAANARVGRLAACVATDEGGHDGAAKFLAQVERHVREAEPVAGLARSDHRLRRA